MPLDEGFQESGLATQAPIFAIYAMGIGVVVAIIGIYKLPEVSLHELASKWGAVMLVGVLVLLSGAIVAVLEWHRCRRESYRAFWIPTLAAIISVVLTLGAAEGLLHLLAVRTDDGVNIGSVRLSPTWAEVVEMNRRLLKQATPSRTWKEPYLVFDRDLGWVVGKSRATPDGLYFSSVEGIRSGEPGVRFADRRSQYRVAIVGDSNAFSLEVSFDQSLGFNLEKILGSDVQVLNFGVNGYGIDQALLRYERDVRPFSPDLVILAFINHDLARSMVVYPFVSFPMWKMPFAKPRFVLTDLGLVAINTPLGKPAQWFDGRDLADLPHLDLDLVYRQSSVWRTRMDGYPMLARLFTTLLPRYAPIDIRAEEETVLLNAALLERFHAVVTREAAALVVYIPTNGGGDFEAPPRENWARRALARASLPYFDLANCVSGVAKADRMVASGEHYSPLANRAMAHCLAGRVSQLLSRDYQQVSIGSRKFDSP